MAETSLLRGVDYSGVAPAERHQAGVGKLVAPPSWCLYIGDLPNVGEPESTLPPPLCRGTGYGCCFCLCA